MVESAGDNVCRFWTQLLLLRQWPAAPPAKTLIHAVSASEAQSREVIFGVCRSLVRLPSSSSATGDGRSFFCRRVSFSLGIDEMRVPHSFLSFLPSFLPSILRSISIVNTILHRLTQVTASRYRSKSQEQEICHRESLWKLELSSYNSKMGPMNPSIHIPFPFPLFTTIIATSSFPMLYARRKKKKRRKQERKKKS